MHRMDSSYWKALVTTHQTRIDFIAAPDEVAAKRPHASEEIARLMRFIRSTYTIAIVDFGRCFSPAALDALSELDTLYLVATLDLTTLEHAKHALGVFERRSGGTDRVKVLLNRVPAHAKPDPQGIQDFLGQSPAGSFTNDFNSLYEAYSEGQLLTATAPLAKELSGLATILRSRAFGEPPAALHEVPRRAATGNTKSWFSFFQRAQG
jgi:Flp pilus assembly CpaE family ATPase